MTVGTKNGWKEWETICVLVTTKSHGFSMPIDLYWLALAVIHNSFTRLVIFLNGIGLVVLVSWKVILLCRLTLLPKMFLLYPNWGCQSNNLIGQYST